jgi:hypothetical protein
MGFLIVICFFCLDRFATGHPLIIIMGSALLALLGLLIYANTFKHVKRDEDGIQFYADASKRQLLYVLRSELRDNTGRILATYQPQADLLFRVKEKCFTAEGKLVYNVREAPSVTNLVLNAVIRVRSVWSSDYEFVDPSGARIAKLLMASAKDRSELEIGRGVTIDPIVLIAHAIQIGNKPWK